MIKYTENDIPNISNKTIAIIGYGSQGKAQSANLRDNGYNNVVIGVRPGKSFESASIDGYNTMPVPDAVKISDIIVILVPDETAPEIFNRDIKPWIHDGQTLIFSNGFNILYSQITPPPNIDVVLVAPKHNGYQTRNLYINKIGLKSIIAIYQDISNSATLTAMAYAKAIGTPISEMIMSTFSEEVETELFTEQVTCGGLLELINESYNTLVSAGYNPKIAYILCINRLKETLDLVYDGGMPKLHESTPISAIYGGITRGKRIIPEPTRNSMCEILTEIQSGSFTKDWLLEKTVNYPQYRILTEKYKNSDIEKMRIKLQQ